MKIKFWEKSESIYDEPITKVLDEMREQSVDTTEYNDAIRHFDTLMKLKANESRKPVSADAVLSVVGSLLGILVIVAYEQKHVFNSKASGFIRKPS